MDIFGRVRWGREKKTSSHMFCSPPDPQPWVSDWGLKRELLRPRRQKLFVSVALISTPPHLTCFMCWCSQCKAPLGNQRTFKSGSLSQKMVEDEDIWNLCEVLVFGADLHVLNWLLFGFLKLVIIGDNKGLIYSQFPIAHSLLERENAQVGELLSSCFNLPHSSHRPV